VGHARDEVLTLLLRGECCDLLASNSSFLIAATAATVSSSASKTTSNAPFQFAPE
jgi:hypothetical protein